VHFDIAQVCLRSHPDFSHVGGDDDGDGYLQDDPSQYKLAASYIPQVGEPFDIV
jgi:hypothetical protein